MPENNVKKQTRVKVVPKPKPEIGVDLENTFLDTIIEAASTSVLDSSKLESFTNVSQQRDQIYSTIDTMTNDSTLSAVLETYATDTVQSNDEGKIVWCESSNPTVANYVTYLLSSLQIDKNIYEWATKLIKYGDVYLKLFRQSDYEEDAIFGNAETEKERLDEAIKLKLDSKSDHFVHYVEAVNNPAEVFELTRLGKTRGYVEAPIAMQTPYGQDSRVFNYFRYKMKQKDITCYGASSFVHGCLQDTSSRVAEEVNIFMESQVNNENVEVPYTYKVKRGQSIFNNVFKVWRELTLLENSVLLSRLTKSAIVRILNVEVADMPKEKVTDFIERLKSKIEQKSALNTNTSMQEYTNPAPIENVIYIPTHEGQGTITQNTMGGDFDPKQLTDIEYFRDKLFGALRIPKQFFGFTEDGAGFNGGESLTIISSRYGKAIQRIQNTLCRMITDLVNIFLIDKEYDSYIGQFTIRMQSPLMADDIKRREDADNRIRYIGDIMTQLGDITDAVPRLKILKKMLSTVVSDAEITQIIQDEIDALEEEAKEEDENPKDNDVGQEEDSFGDDDLLSFDNETPSTTPMSLDDNGSISSEPTETSEPTVETEPEVGGGESDRLPSADEIGIDMTQNI